MKDIVERLRNWRTVHLTQLRYLMESAADEIERLRLSARADCPEPENAANEEKVSMRQNMTTLTPVERCVLREVRHGYADVDDVRCAEIAYVIDRLLSRAGSNGETAGEHAAKCTVASAKLPERERVADAEQEVVRLRKKETELLAAGDLLESQLFSVAKHRDALRLTAAEREAVQRARDSIASTMPYESVQSAADWKALRGLLKRMGGDT